MRFVLRGMIRVACVLAAAVVIVTVTPREARADAPTCGTSFQQWLASCSARTGVALVPDHCGDGVAVVETVVDGVHARVEIADASLRHSSFSRAGEFGLSPLGNYSDWGEAPEPIRRGFDAVRGCVEARAPRFRDDPSLQDGAIGDVASRGRIALAMAVIAAWSALVAIAARRHASRIDIGLAAVAVVGGVLFRHLTIGAAFFHQNGHGPGWVAMALCRPSDYGPGYGSIFHLAARAGGVSAERGVFVAQEILASLAIIAVYALARGVGAARAIACAASLAVGIEPLLARLARSESYYATILWLLLLAAAALLVAGPRIQRREPLAIAGAVIAGGLLGIAVTVHPVAWVPAATIPAVVFLRRGSRARTVRLAMITAALVAVVVALVAARPALGVLHGPLGRQWSLSTPSGSKLLATAILAVVPWIVGLALPRRFRVWLVPLVLGYVAFRLDVHTNLLGTHIVNAPGRAWRWLFAVAPVAGAVALAATVQTTASRRIPRRIVVTTLAAAIAIVGCVHAASTFSRSTLLPTDALEAARFAPMLRALPRGTRVVYLARADLMVQELPIYSACVPGPVVHPLRAQNGPRQLVPGEYWFRSATCSTSAGQGLCDEIERTAVLRTIHEARFPARRSTDYLPYDSTEIRSGLYRVEAIRGR